MDRDISEMGEHHNPRYASMLLGRAVRAFHRRQPLERIGHAYDRYATCLRQGHTPGIKPRRSSWWHNLCYPCRNLALFTCNVTYFPIMLPTSQVSKNDVLSVGQYSNLERGILGLLRQFRHCRSPSKSQISRKARGSWTRGIVRLTEKSRLRT